VTTPALTVDEVLTTTRAVRRRLDLTKPVEREKIEECIRLAQQAPAGSNLQLAHFVVVTDPEKRVALAECWRKGYEIYKPMPISIWNLRFDDEREASRPRIAESVEYLVEHLHEVPVHVIPCVGFRAPQGGPSMFLQSTVYGSILPAAWSFMLAARSRGLVGCWTTFHLEDEKQAAEVLGIPYDDVMQTGLIPIAYPIGSDFKPAYRLPLEQITHWDSW